MTPRNDMPKKTPFNGAELQQIYRVRFGKMQAYRDTVWQVLIRDYFQKFVRETDTVVDIGAGYGEFINNIRCAKKYALDLNPDTAERVGADVDLLQQDCSAPWSLPDNSVDVIFTSNFFEHLPDTMALARTLREAQRCLRPGGRIIAMGPNIKYLPGVYWDFLDHHIPLTENSLAEAFVQEGLEIESSIAKFMPFTMVGGLQYPTFFVSLYLRFPFVWRILGRQFLVIGRKGSI